jgi:hypothetical protein
MHALRIVLVILAVASGIPTYTSYLAFVFLELVQAGDPPSLPIAMQQNRVGKIGSIVAIVTLLSTLTMFRSTYPWKYVARLHAFIAAIVGAMMATAWFTIWFGRQ